MTLGSWGEEHAKAIRILDDTEAALQQNLVSFRATRRRKRRRRHKRRRERRKMLKLSWWEEFIIGGAISFLTVLQAKVTNQAELAAIQAAIAFLNRLMAGNVSTT